MGAALPESTEAPVQHTRKRQVHGAFGNAAAQAGVQPSKSSKHSLTQLPGEFLQVQLDS